MSRWVLPVAGLLKCGRRKGSESARACVCYKGLGQIRPKLRTVCLALLRCCVLSASSCFPPIGRPPPKQVYPTLADATQNKPVISADGTNLGRLDLTNPQGGCQSWNSTGEGAVLAAVDLGVGSAEASRPAMGIWAAERSRRRLQPAGRSLSGPALLRAAAGSRCTRLPALPLPLPLACPASAVRGHGDISGRLLLVWWEGHRRALQQHRTQRLVARCEAACQRAPCACRRGAVLGQRVVLVLRTLAVRLVCAYNLLLSMAVLTRSCMHLCGPCRQPVRGRLPAL